MEATERYSDIEVIENTNADDLKAQMRAAIDRQSSVSEIFFYFTGHGYQQDYEFYYCATEFDASRPNATGISTDELHALLSIVKATVVVKVIDACNSGTVLVKSGQGFFLEKEPRFKSLIQISSCLDSQNSLAGQPLSAFTEKFRDSALRKKKGVVHYTDIVSTLRDEFINNQEQTPFFVTQGTASGTSLWKMPSVWMPYEQGSCCRDKTRRRSDIRRCFDPRYRRQLCQSCSTAAEQQGWQRLKKIASFADSLFDALEGKRICTDKEFSCEFFELDIVTETFRFSKNLQQKNIIVDV